MKTNELIKQLRDPSNSGASCKELVLAAAEELERVQRRLNWAANELLACDYGDNDKGGVGWLVYGWRQPKDVQREDRKRIYGSSINEAIDAEIP